MSSLGNWAARMFALFVTKPKVHVAEPARTTQLSRCSMLRTFSRVRIRESSRRQFSCVSKHLQDARSPTAPKQIPDIRGIRADPLLYEQNAILRNYQKHADAPRRISELWDQAIALKKAANEPRKRLRKLEQELGAAKSRGDNDKASEVHREVAPLRSQVDEMQVKEAQYEQQAYNMALALPNLTSSHTPRDGKEKLIGYLNYEETNPPSFDNGADHSVIGTKLGLLDFTSASIATGWGFYYLLNEAAILEQALVQYAISVAMRHGWRMVAPPSLVYSYMADSCGFQPRDANDEQQIWQVAQSERDVGKPRRSLAATAEIPLAAIHASKDIAEDQLPLKLVGSSRCYRAEAGARGVDTKGLYRVHEFTKVEMFAWTANPSSFDKEDGVKDSTAVFDEMVNIQREILQGLNLPCRILEMPSSDLGASAYRKIDIEALFPSRMSRDGGWGEVTSVSICTDYQSRRLGTRIKEKSGARSKFPHTVNGTALAVPRVLAAIMENSWREQHGCIDIPEVLWPYMHGIKKIGPRQ